jgi:DNA polymerase III epsilon subunit family exonuclease
MTSRLTDIEYIAFDLETTGFTPEDCEIVEIGAVRFAANGREIDRFQQLINPQCEISYAAGRVHGITNEMVRGQPLLREGIPDFMEFLAAGPAVMMAHNAPFDLRFLSAALRKTKLRQVPRHPVIDTVSLARARLPKLSNHKLPELRDHFRISTSLAHRALHDSLVLKQVFLSLTKVRPAVTHLDDIYRMAPPRELGR